MAGNRGGALLRLPGQPAGNKCPPHPHAAKQLEPELALPRSSCLQAAMDRRLQLLARATAAVDCRGGPGRMRAVTCLTCGAKFASRNKLFKHLLAEQHGAFTRTSAAIAQLASAIMRQRGHEALQRCAEWGQGGDSGGALGCCAIDTGETILQLAAAARGASCARHCSCHKAAMADER